MTQDNEQLLVNQSYRGADVYKTLQNKTYLMYGVLFGTWNFAPGSKSRSSNLSTGGRYALNVTSVRKNRFD